MPKPAAGSSKALATKVRAKGLQKLKWFCQMCQKQCRDQNGFKCHLTSESHQRQLLLFAENEGSYLKEFSREFETAFLQILRMTFGLKRVRANDVYQEYIKDRGNVHMNATVWHTLSGFVQHLGEDGICKIDQNEKGWHVQLIDKEEEMRREQLREKVKQEKSDEERLQEVLMRQMERGKELMGKEEEKEAEVKEFARENEEEKIKFELAPMRPKKETPSLIKTDHTADDDEIKPRSTEVKKKSSEPPKKPGAFKPVRVERDANGKRKTALEQLREEEERFKEKRNRKDYWLHEGIIVKIVTKKHGSDFYKAKGEVKRVIDNYRAEVKLPEGDVIKVDQEDLETVIPAVGRQMLIVNGAYRGSKAELEELMEKKFLLRLRISEGTRHGRVVEVSYEDASKLVV